MVKYNNIEVIIIKVRSAKDGQSSRGSLIFVGKKKEAFDIRKQQSFLLIKVMNLLFVEVKTHF